MAANKLRARLRAGQTSYGLWVTLESPTVSEIAAALGVDWLCVDMEHGHQDFREAAEHLRAVRGSDTSVVVRVPEVTRDYVKRALDVGAHGVLLPLVKTAEDVARGLGFGRYPPAGERGVGGERAVQWGLGFNEYLASANEETLIIPIIERYEAVDNIDAILAVPGLEAIFFGPSDLSTSYGYLGQWEGPGVADKILMVREKAAARGIGAGLMAQSVENAVMRRDQGFALVALGADTSMLIRALTQGLEAVRGKPEPRLWF
jgi:2-keto-3-deoxy-L-rhamnonate aldolase RhmA